MAQLWGVESQLADGAGAQAVNRLYVLPRT